MKDLEIIKTIASLPPHQRDEVLGNLKETFGSEQVSKWIVEATTSKQEEWKPTYRNNLRAFIDNLYDYEEEYVNKYPHQDKAEVRFRFIKIRENLMNPKPQSIKEFVERVTFNDDLTHDEKFAISCKILPPTIDEFIELDHYMGSQTNNGKLVYPGWRQLLRECFPTRYTSTFEIIVLSGCIGAGKSTVSRLIMSYCACRLMCIAEAKTFYRHVPTTKYNFFSWAPTVGTAGAVLVDEINGMLNDSPFFQQERAKNGGYLPYDIEFTAGSRPSHNVGRALPMAIMSEVNFEVLHNQSSDNFALIYRRMQSRFMLNGHLPFPILIDSSIATDNDFTARLKKDYKSKLDQGLMKVVEWPIWNIKPRKNYSSETFTVFCGTSKMDPFIMEDASKEDQELILNDDELCHLVIDVPKDFYTEFVSDIKVAIRDIAGIATAANSSFIPSVQHLDEQMKEVNPCLQEVVRTGIKSEHDSFNLIDNLAPWYLEQFGEDTDQEMEETDYSPENLFQKINSKKLFSPYDQRTYDRRPRFLHFDLGFVKDLFGISCSVITGFKDVLRRDPRTGNEVTVKEPIFKTEWVMYVGSVPGDEVPIYKIKELCVDLRNAGMNIPKISMDGHQSRNLKQDLIRLEFDAYIESCDRSKEPYIMWRRAMMEGRWTGPESKLLYKEFSKLIDTGKKIDHPTDGSKDGSDAVVGSIFGLYNLIDFDVVEDNSKDEEECLDFLNDDFDDFDFEDEEEDVEDMVKSFLGM
ncbi:terminase large subunit [Vibrio phage Va2]|nr:terminase large subunit [Vibrio phage Va2]